MWPARPVTAAQQAFIWLRPQQSLTDGGYGGDSGSVEALLSIGANSYSASEWRRQPDAPSLASSWLWARKLTAGTARPRQGIWPWG